MMRHTSISKAQQSQILEEEDRELWQETSLVLAPSGHGEGWGVIAARSFQKGEMVELAPLFLRFSDARHALLKETILNNYHYEYWAWNGLQDVHELQAQISFGYTLYYNHDTNHANIQYQKFCDEPYLDQMDRAAAIGYFALRDIEAGEELLTDYGGARWFQERFLTLVEEETVTTTTAKKQKQKQKDNNDNDNSAHERNSNNSKPIAISTSKLQQQTSSSSWRHKDNKNYRSKVYGGYGLPAFQKVLDCHANENDSSDSSGSILDDAQPPLYRMETLLPYLPPRDAGFGNVRTKERVQAGDTLEFAPALLLAKASVEHTLLQGFAIFDWIEYFLAAATEEEEEALRPEQVQIHFQPDVEPCERPIKREVPVEASVLVPLAGTIGLMARRRNSSVNNSNDPMTSDCTFNAQLHVEKDKHNADSFCCRVIATQSMNVGERVVLNLPLFCSSTAEDIMEELALTGQPIAPNLLTNVVLLEEAD